MQRDESRKHDLAPEGAMFIQRAILHVRGNAGVCRFDIVQSLAQGVAGPGHGDRKPPVERLDPVKRVVGVKRAAMGGCFREMCCQCGASSCWRSNRCDLFERLANANLAYVLGVIREWCFNPVSESAAHVACAV